MSAFVSQIITETIKSSSNIVRTSQHITEVVHSGSSKAAVSLITVELIHAGSSSIRATQILLEIIYNNAYVTPSIPSNKALISQIIAETVCDVTTSIAYTTQIVIETIYQGGGTSNVSQIIIESVYAGLPNIYATQILSETVFTQVIFPRLTQNPIRTLIIPIDNVLKFTQNPIRVLIIPGIGGPFPHYIKRLHSGGMVK